MWTKARRQDQTIRFNVMEFVFCVMYLIMIWRFLQLNTRVGGGGAVNHHTSASCYEPYILHLSQTKDIVHIFNQPTSKQPNEYCQERDSITLLCSFPLYFLCLTPCPHDSIQQPHCVRYTVVFVPDVDWPIMPDCVPWGKHYPSVVSEWPNYASALSVTMGSPRAIWKVFQVAKPQESSCDSIINQRIT